MLAVVILLHVLAFTSAEQCSAFYSLNTTCNVTYGTLLTRYEREHSIIRCAARCNANSLCKSLVYSESSRTCSINSQTLIASQIGCGSDVTYAEAHGKMCTSDTMPPPVPTTATTLVPTTTEQSTTETPTVLTTNPTSFVTTTSMATTTFTAASPTATAWTVPTEAVPTTTPLGTTPTTTRSPTSTNLTADAFCSNGDRYDPASAGCVPDCTGSYSTTFQYDPQRRPSFFGCDEGFEGIDADPEQCRQLCISETSFVCATFYMEYFQIGGNSAICMVTDCTLAAATDVYTDATFAIWHRDCQ